MTEEEWGPWIEHDGKGCPVPNGTMVHAIYSDFEEIIARVSANGRPKECNPWISEYLTFHIIRYRIRKPRGMTILEEITRKVKEPEKETTQ